MKASLQVRLSQHLALTPQLQQSIRLLQLSTLELQQEVEQMLEQNPFLEEDVEAPDERYELAAPAEVLPGVREAEREREVQEQSERADVGEEFDAVPALDAAADAADDWHNGTEGDDFEGVRETPLSRNGAMDEDDSDPVDRASEGLTLEEHLRQQVRGMRLGPEDAAALEVLIGSLNDDGYLADAIEEIVDRLAAPDDAAAREELVDRLRCALKWLQSLEPTGVGARDLSECLVLQLRALPADAVDAEVRVVAILICKQHLPELARRDLRRIAQALGVDEPVVKAAQALIVRLEPKPGRPFVRVASQLVVPDVIVRKAGRGWKVVLNPDVMPRLRIHDQYAQALRQHRGSEGAPALSARLQEARWFVKNILQRFDTIQRVAQAIVERQKNFFSHGAIAMKPLVLREIADELGLHESTISRVTTAKYMATPFGTYELKYFFGSSLNTEAGGNASSTAVRALIRQLVSAEDPAHPLSDSQLSSMLEEQGIQVARRTVAKYREALKIAPANLRKAL